MSKSREVHNLENLLCFINFSDIFPSHHMKKHDLYFEIKKNLVFSLLNFLSKSFYALSKWMIKLQYN